MKDGDFAGADIAGLTTADEIARLCPPSRLVETEKNERAQRLTLAVFFVSIRSFSLRDIMSLNGK